MFRIYFSVCGATNSETTFAVRNYKIILKFVVRTLSRAVAGRRCRQPQKTAILQESLQEAEVGELVLGKGKAKPNGHHSNFDRNSTEIIDDYIKKQNLKEELRAKLIKSILNK